MKTIVSKNWLLARLYEPDLVIVDCRFVLGDPSAGRRAYEVEHIPGAIYISLEEDLSGSVGTHGGRHPLPDPEQLALRLSKAGIGSSSRVIAYDDQGGMFAARLWWLLRYLGHEQVYVMNDGFSAWKHSGYPATTDQHVVVPQTFVPNIQHQMLADVNDIRNALDDPNVILVDSRDPRRYAGLEEPLDARAGHIPGAVNSFWQQVLNEQGAWKSDSELRTHFSSLTDQLNEEREIVVYCGSGISACPNFLALQQIGVKNVRLYAGSWSDWISYKDNPVETGEK